MFLSKAHAIHRQRKNTMARRKCRFLNNRVYFIHLKRWKQVSFITCFCSYRRKTKKCVIFIFVLIDQSLSKSLPEMGRFSYLLFPCFKWECLPHYKPCWFPRLSVVWLCCDYWSKPLITVYSLCSCLEIGLRVSGSSRSPLSILLKQYCWTEGIVPAFWCALSAAHCE